MRDRQGERGAALVLSLAMLMALGIVGAALVFTAGTDLKVAGSDRRGTQAQVTAEAGVREAMHRMALRPGTPLTVNGVTFDPAIRDTASTPDPDWEVRLYSPDEGTPTSSDPSLTYSPTVQDASTGLDYLRNGSFLSIRHKWRDLDGDDVREAGEVLRYDSGRLPPENFNSGSPIEVIEVAGHRSDARRRLRVEVTRFPFSPNVTAAVSADGVVDVRGNVHICGQNHTVDTPDYTHLETAPACSPNYDEADGHLFGVTTTGDDVEVTGSTNLMGTPTAFDSSSTNPFYTLAEALGVTQDVIDQLLADPDYTSATQCCPMDGITYINGNATGGEKFDDARGSGLLYVNGNLDIAGNTVWRGLIYVEGDVRITGTPWILGGIVVRGDGNPVDPAFGGGTPNILYSREMIRLALELAFDYVILSWKEL
ncbi:MAG: pilus assembly PilX N-terminal domain-containing protein [Candidatus Latescibacterota bacterium]|nr:MAG: pilus assembly PilX N-terminal domain-containing protein [Candidatus Latescibacterota bacterium]